MIRVWRRLRCTLNPTYKMKILLIYVLAPVKVFLHGMREFKTDLTANYDSHPTIGECQEVYDAGRDFAHFITLRRFDS